MENDLIQRARTGDQNAFGELIEMYSNLVSRVARVLVTDRFLAEDAVQEAWLDVWRNLSQFRSDRPFRPWLLTIVANRCRKSNRKVKTANVSLDANSVRELQAATDLEAFVLTASDIAEVRAALAGLKVEQQQVLALRYFAELELEEIAQLTHSPLGTVKSRIHRALNTMRTRLRQQEAVESTLE
jgi:RNA polymerase sigma-70 factor, ECF subfamily